MIANARCLILTLTLPVALWIAGCSTEPDGALARVDHVRLDAVPVRECEPPLVHDLPDLAGSCTYGTTRCNGTAVELCLNDAAGTLHWDHVATCATECVGDGSCGVAESAGVDLPDAEVAALAEQVEAECAAATGDPTCGVGLTPFDPDGSIAAAIAQLESHQGPACWSCAWFSNQPCACDPREDPSSFCYDESAEPGGGGTGTGPVVGETYLLGPIIRLAQIVFKVGKSGAKIGGFARKFADHYKKAQGAYDRSLAASRAGNKALAKALARESIAEVTLATVQLTLAGAELVIVGATIKEGLDQLAANPDANQVVVTIDGEKVNLSREKFNAMAKEYGEKVKELKKQVTDLEHLMKEADKIIKE